MNTDFGTDFGQKVDLTASIRNILRNYPEGTAILKELVQNADDAGARTVSFCLDHRIHNASKLASKSLEQFQGPSLLIYNNAIFTETDFQSIQRIGDSLKKSEDSKAKIGRFGIGFNAVYHWTDLPSFVSNKYLVMLDPQAKYLPNVNPSNPGKIIDFVTNPDILNQFPDQFAPYFYNNNNFKKPFQGTLFRLPLRTNEQAVTSMLSKRALTVDNARALFEALQLEASAMLLFLKNIECIEIQEWREGAQAPIALFRCEIANPTTELRQKRNIISSHTVGGGSNPNNILYADYALSISCVNCNHPSNGAAVQYLETWEVCNQLGGQEASRIANNPDNALLRLIPWGGVAACIRSVVTSGASDGRELSGVRAGLAYCFLPLPVQTGLPVMCNGFFELSSNRRDVWQAGVDMTGDGQTRAAWNIALMRDVISVCYSRLLIKCCSTMGFSSEYQALWPVSRQCSTQPWSEVVRATLLLCRDKKLLCITRSTPDASNGGQKLFTSSGSSASSAAILWIEPCNALLLPLIANNSSLSSSSSANSNSSPLTAIEQEQQDQLSSFLILAKTSIVLCSDSLRDTLITTGSCANIATPAVVRGILQKRVAATGIGSGSTSRPSSSVISAYTIEVTMCKFLLHYCLSDLKPTNTTTNIRELTNLTLLPLLSSRAGLLTMYTDAQCGAIGELVGMGFSLVPVIKTLRQCGYDVMAAVEALTNLQPGDSKATQGSSSASNEIYIIVEDEEAEVFRAASEMLVDKRMVGAAEFEFLSHANMLKYSNIRLFRPEFVADVLRHVLPKECFTSQFYAVSSSDQKLVQFVSAFWQYLSTHSSTNTAILQALLHNVAIVPTIDCRALFTLSRVSNLLVTSKGDVTLSAAMVALLTSVPAVHIVEPSVLTNAIATMMPRLFFEYVHSPSRSGVLAALEFVLREHRPSTTPANSGKLSTLGSATANIFSNHSRGPLEALSNEQRDELRLYIATGEAVRSLTEAECGTVCRLPIFANFTQQHLPLHQQQYQDISPGGGRTYFTLSDFTNIATELLPESCLRHSTTAEFSLLEKLGVKVLRRVDYFRSEFLPSISQHYGRHPEATLRVAVDMLLEMKNLSGVDSSFASYARSVAFIPCGQNESVVIVDATNVVPLNAVKLCRGYELFDPAVSELVSLLDARFFPAAQFQSEDLLAVLRSQLGLQTTIEWSGVIACARAVEDIPDEFFTVKQARGGGLLAFLEKNVTRLLSEEKQGAAIEAKRDSAESSGSSFSLFNFTSSLFGSSSAASSAKVLTNTPAVKEADQKPLPIAEYIKQLQHIAWLPVCLTAPHPLLPWSSDKLTPCCTPLKSSLAADMWLCSSSRRIVLATTLSSGTLASTNLRRVLGWDQPLEVVCIATQLMELSRKFTTLLSVTEGIVAGVDEPAASPAELQLQEFRELINSTAPQLYSRLNGSETGNYQYIRSILSTSSDNKVVAWVWVGDRFVELERVACAVAVNAVPYLHQLPSELTGYSRLFVNSSSNSSVGLFKVKSVFGSADYIAVLRQMAVETNAWMPLPFNAVKIAPTPANINKIAPLSESHVNIAVSLVTLLNSSSDSSESGTNRAPLFEGVDVYIPDKHNKLALSSELINDDVPWLSGNEYISIRIGCRLIHPNISSSVAERLGVKSLRRVLISKNMEQNLFALNNSTSNNPGGGGAGSTMESFGQAESLTNRLKTILDMYPDGNPIFSELIQNADDAGASVVRILLDDNSYGTESLLDPRMGALQGPSLVVFNNAVFSESDYKNLASIGQGSKLDKLATTGRFGLGFNSTYHLTDTPSIVSGDYLVVFDPHCAHVPGATNNQPGIRIKFNNEDKPSSSSSGGAGNTLVTTFRNQFEPFQYFGCDFEQAFEGTLFRFPLRTTALAKQSLISKRSYTVADLEANLAQLITQLPNLLLFLRSVKTIEIYHNNANCREASSKPVLLHRATAKVYDAQTKNDQSLLHYFDKNSQVLAAAQPVASGSAAVSSRDAFYNKLWSTPDAALPEHMSKIHIEIDAYSGAGLLPVDSAGSAPEDGAALAHEEVDYLVVSGLCGGEAKRIACDQAMRHFKLVPMGAVAACISRLKSSVSSSSGSSATAGGGGVLESYPALQGLAFCFLPLPVHTQLPVHINAYWELSSNRRDIWRGDDTKGEAKLRSDWNVQVMKDVIAPLYARLLTAIHRDTAQANALVSVCDKNQTLLSLLPCPLPHKPWDMVANSLFPLIKHEALLFSNLNNGVYVSLSKAHLFLRDDIHSDTASSSLSTEMDFKTRLESLLLLERIPVVLVPTAAVLATLLESQCAGGEVCPELIRNHFNVENEHNHAGTGPPQRQVQRHPAISVNAAVKTPAEMIDNAAFLLTYCFSDLRTARNASLEGVLLLPLEDSSALGVFSRDLTSSAVYYLVNDLERRLLGAKSGGSIVASEAVLGATVFNAIKESQFLQQYNVQQMDTLSLLKLVCAFLPKSWLASTTLLTAQDTQVISNEWLQALWQYVIDNKAVDLFTDVIPILPVVVHPPTVSSAAVVSSAKAVNYLVKISVRTPVLHMSFRDSVPVEVARGLGESLGIFIFDVSVLGATSYSHELAKLLSLPTARGFMNALHSVLDGGNKKELLHKMTTHWSNATKAACQQFMLDHVLFKLDPNTFTGEDVGLLTSMPIWLAHSSLEDGQSEEDLQHLERPQNVFSGIDNKALVLPPHGVSVLLLDRKYVRMRDERDRALYVLLGFKEQPRGSFYGFYLVPKVVARQIPDQHVDAIVVEILRNLPALEGEHMGLSQLLKTSPLIRNNQGGLCVVTTLYDPDAAYMKSFLSAETMFPSAALYCGDIMLLSGLRSLGLQNTLSCEGVLKAAQAIQSDHTAYSNSIAHAASAAEVQPASVLDSVLSRSAALLMYLQSNIERLVAESDASGLQLYLQSLQGSSSPDIPLADPASETALQILGGKWSQTLRSISFVPVFLQPPNRNQQTIYFGLPWPVKSHLSPLATPSQSTHIDNIVFSSSTCRICNVMTLHDAEQSAHGKQGELNTTRMLFTVLGWNKPISGRNLAIQLTNIKFEYDVLVNSKDYKESATNAITSSNLHRLQDYFSKMMDSLFQRLFKAFSRESAQERDLWLNLLNNKPILYIKHRFIEPSRVALRALPGLDTEPFLYAATPDLLPYSDLLLLLGVKPVFAARDIAQLTRDLYANNIRPSASQSHSPSDVVVVPLNHQKHALVVGIIKLLFKLVNGEAIPTEGDEDDSSALSDLTAADPLASSTMSENSVASSSTPLPAADEIDIASLGVIYLPDAQAVLAAATALTYDDAPWISSALNANSSTNGATGGPSSNGIRFVSTKVENKIAAKLGCLSLREQLFNGNEILCPDADKLKELLDDDEDGVREALVDIVSLGDSLGAGQVSFTYDDRSHGSTSLIHPGLRDAQGAALVAFIDGPQLSTEDVLKLLTLPQFDLSEGDNSPSVSSAQTSALRTKFRPSMGKRLFSAFAITDCLQIVTGSELYIFDPCGQFLFTDTSASTDKKGPPSSAHKVNRLSKNHHKHGASTGNTAQSAAQKQTPKAQHYSFSNREKSNGTKGGKSNTISNVLARFPDQFSGFMDLPNVHFRQHVLDHNPIRGVIIRMPLRVAKSTLSRTVTSCADIQVLYGDFKAHMSGALLFAKTLSRLALYHFEIAAVDSALVARDKASKDASDTMIDGNKIINIAFVADARLDVEVKLVSDSTTVRNARHDLLADKGWQTRGLTKMFTKAFVPSECMYTVQLLVNVFQGGGSNGWIVPSVQLREALARAGERFSQIEEWLLCSSNGINKLRDLCVSEPYLSIRLQPFVTVAIQILAATQLSAIGTPPETGQLFNTSTAISSTGLPFHVEGQFVQLNIFHDAQPVHSARPHKGQYEVMTAAPVKKGHSPEEIGAVQQWNDALISVAVEVLYPRLLTELKSRIERDIFKQTPSVTSSNSSSSSTASPTAVVARTVAYPQAMLDVGRGFYKYFIFKRRVAANILKIINQCNILVLLSTNHSVFLSKTGFCKLSDVMLPVKVFNAELTTLLEGLLALAVCPTQLSKDLVESQIRIASLSAQRLRSMLKSNVLLYTNRLVGSGSNKAASDPLHNVRTIVLPLLQYVLSDMSSNEGEFALKKLFRELAGVPLLLTATGSLKMFPMTRDSAVAIAPPIFHALLPQLGDSLLHPSCVKECPLFSNVMFMDSLFITHFNAGFLNDKIGTLLPPTWRGVNAVQWVASSSGEISSASASGVYRSIGRMIGTSSSTAVTGGSGSLSSSQEPLATFSAVGPPSELLIYCLWNNALSLESWQSLSKLQESVLVPVITNNRRVLLSASLFQYVFTNSASNSQQDANRQNLKRDASRLETLAQTNGQTIVAGADAFSSAVLVAEDPWRWTAESCETTDPVIAKYVRDAKLGSSVNGESLAQVAASTAAWNLASAAHADSDSDGDNVILNSDDEDEEEATLAAAMNMSMQQGLSSSAAPAVTAALEMAPQAAVVAQGGYHAMSEVLVAAMTSLGVPFLDTNIFEGIPLALSPAAGQEALSVGRRLLESLHVLSSLSVTVYKPALGSNELTESGPLLTFDVLSSTHRNAILIEMFTSGHRVTAFGPTDIDKLRHIPLFTNSKDGSVVVLADCKGGVYWCVDDSVLEGLVTLQKSSGISAITGPTFVGSNINSSSSSSSSSSSLAADSTVPSTEPPIILIYEPALKDLYLLLAIEELTHSSAAKKFIIPSLATMNNQSRLDIMLSIARKWPTYKTDAALVAILKEVSFIPQWEAGSESEVYATPEAVNQPLRKAVDVFSWKNVELLDALQGGSLTRYFSPPYLRSPELLAMCTDLGMLSEVSEDSFMQLVVDIQEAAKGTGSQSSSVSSSSSQSVDSKGSLVTAGERGRRLLRYILQSDRIFVLFQNNQYTRKVSKIAFVPMKLPVRVTEGGFVTYEDAVGSFDRLVAKQQGALAFTVLPILEDDITPPLFYFSHLGITSSPSIDIVLRHLRNLTFNSESLLDRWNCSHFSIQQTFNALFAYLSEHWASISPPVKDALTQLPLIPIGHSLIKPTRLFFKLADDLSPFMHEIPRYFGTHEVFLKLLGIRETPSPADYVQFLSDLSQESNQNALNPNELRAVIAILTSIATSHSEDLASSSSSTSSGGDVSTDLFVPDEDSVMRKLFTCLFNDNTWLKNRSSGGLHHIGYFILHPSIGLSNATLLGVRKLGDVLVEKLSTSGSDCMRDVVENNAELSALYTKAVNSPIFVDSLSALISSGGRRGSEGAESGSSGDPVGWQSKLRGVKLVFVRSLQTGLKFILPNKQTLSIVAVNDHQSGGSGSHQSISFVESVNGGAESTLLVNVPAVQSPITMEIAVCSGVCRMLSLDITLSTSLACILTVAVSVVHAQTAQSGDNEPSGAALHLLNLLRIGNDQHTVRESLRGVPGELVTEGDKTLLELRPFRVFRQGEIIAYEESAVGSEGDLASVPVSEGATRYGRIVSVGEASETGIRRLTVKIAANAVCVKLSTEVYSFKSAREVGSAPQQRASSSIGGTVHNRQTASSAGHSISSAPIASSSVHPSSTSSTPLSAHIGQDELLSVVSGLLTRAGVPVSLEQQAMISKIVDLESSVKRSQTELQAEREQLVKAKESLESAASAYKCQICLTDDITHVLVPCGHTFCGTCVNQLQRNKCAMCRANIDKKIKFFVSES